MARSDYQVPTENGRVVIVPPAETLPRLVRANAERIAAYDFDVHTVPAAELARQARGEFLRLAAEYTASLGVDPGEAPAGPIVATGHQPVLFHPGIWLKNHLAGRVAAAVCGAGVNFIVNNDEVDLRTIKTPADEGEGFEVRAVPFIDCPRGVAAEELTVSEEAPRALAEAARLAGAVLGEILADDFAAAAAPTAQNAADFIARPRRHLEERFGVRNLELPVSRLCGTRAFVTFCAHIVGNAERFVSTHNTALRRHRAEHGIRNPLEPVPDLGGGRQELELPFWVWRAGERRRPLTVAPDASPDVIRRMIGSGLKVRPRALAMTLFFRLFCCDLFIHGLGGARYEPVNDAIIREFFGAEPPGYAAASATLFVEPRAPARSAEDVAELRQRIRRMRATPERFLDACLPDDAEARELAARRRALVDQAGVTKRERRRAFAESKRLAARLQARLAPHILGAEQELARAETLRSARAAQEDRDYPFFFHAPTALAALYAFPALRAGAG